MSMICRGKERSAQGLRVVVTGASGVFGRAVCEYFADRGAHVVGLDLMPKSDDPIPVIACDITDEASAVAGVEQALEQLGGLDILINNAGIGGPSVAERPPDAEADRQLQINLLGAWRVSAACTSALVEARGRVVMVASRMAVMPLPLAAAYGVSKRALVAYADTLRLELAPDVTVSTVYPSAVRSPIHDSTKAAGLSLEGVSRYESLEGVVGAVAHAGLAIKAPRDLPTSRRGALEFQLARHFPGLVDRMVLKTIATRVRAGDLDRAPLAVGMLSRYGRKLLVDRS